MGEAEVKIFVVMMAVVMVVFITGILLLVFQYRSRKLQYEQEKANTAKQHQMELLSNQVQTQQDTMQYIGSELHDSITQKLGLAAIYSQKLDFENKYPEIQDRLLHISEIINTSLTELRDLSRTLVNTQIRESSLEELLIEEQRRIDDTGMCKVELEVDLTRPVNFVARTSLLRVIQEFTQNSLKHAECSTICIIAKEEAEGLSIQLSDDGKGFDLQYSRSGGIGMNNMKRRVRQLGSSFDLRSEPGKGTQLHLLIPFTSL